MVPIAGHVLRVEAPWVGSVLIDSRYFLFSSDFCQVFDFGCERSVFLSTREDSWAYLIPNRDSLVKSK